MKYVKVSVDAPMLPNQTGIKHVATSYQIGKDKNLNIQENVLVESLKDTTNLRMWYARVDVADDAILFIRAKYHFTLNGEDKESNWSRTIPVDVNQTGIKISNSLVKTPTVGTELTENEKINITTSELSMWNGAPEHKSTSYRIADSDNTIVWHRDRDEDNLISIEVDDVFKPGKLYTVEAMHTNVTNNDSNYGKTIYLNSALDKELFSFEAPEDFIQDRKFYYRLKIWTGKYKSYDLEIRDSDDNVVHSLKNDARTTNYVLLDMLLKNKKYHIYVRINFTDGTSSLFYKVYESYLLENRVIPYKPLLEYRNKFHNTGEETMNGLSCACIRETFDNKIIAPDFGTNTLYLWKNVDNRLVKIKELYTFEGNLDLDYINIIQLPNHDILVDTVLYNKAKQARTTFIKFEWDPIRLLLTKLDELERPDERYSTAVSNSMVVTTKGIVWYIPAAIVPDDTENRQFLKLRKFHPESMTIMKEYELPVKVRYHANVIIGNRDDLYVLGGSITNKYIDDDKNKTEYWTLDNKEVHRFDPTTEEFTLFNVLVADIPETMYNIQPFLRVDGKIVFLNAVTSGDGLSFQDIIVLDLENSAYSVTKVDSKISIPFRTNIALVNGNIKRISSKVQDPQSSRTYISNTLLDTQIKDLNEPEKESSELVVDDGEVVNIEDIYKYTTITIKGSGLIKWFRPQGITTLDSKTLIVNSKTITTEEKLAAAKYESILVLQGSSLTISSTTN